MKDIKRVTELEVEGKHVLVRVDFNLPLDEGRILDDSRIFAALPTIKYLISSKARIIITTHLGRPGGKVKEELRLDPVAQHLSNLLQQSVIKVDQILGREVDRAVSQLGTGQVLMLENLRFNPGEKACDSEFVDQLASLGDCYVNDAFGAAHRKHASTWGVARALPSAAGFLLLRELEVIQGALEDPERPFLALLGGAKIGDKIGVIKTLLEIADGILIGGGMANTFLRAQGHQLGESLVDEEAVAEARELMALADEKGVEIKLPTDCVVAEEFSAEAAHRVSSPAQVAAGERVLDIGPEARAEFLQSLKGAKTVIWNGPLGVFEWPAFARGTRELVNALAGSEATTIIGGGESAAVVKELGLEREMTHLSTGGGAFLQLLAEKTLPALEVLK